MSVKHLEAFRKGLSENGYVEGRNVAIEFRWAGGRDDRMPELAVDLVRRQVAVIVAPASTAAALAAKAATSSIPIVFGVGSDPVELGLVTSLNRPGGNVTGVKTLNVELTAKRLGLLRELAPQATRFVALVSPNAALTDPIVKEVHASVPTLGVPVEILYAAESDRDLVAAFANLSQKPGTALLVNPNAFFLARRASRRSGPACYLASESNNRNRPAMSRVWGDRGGCVCGRSGGAAWGMAAVTCHDSVHQIITALQGRLSYG